MRIESIRFQNFKLLRDATLPLEPLTVIVGPNNSGKSTVFDALRILAASDYKAFVHARSFGLNSSQNLVDVELRFDASAGAVTLGYSAQEHAPGGFSVVQGWPVPRSRSSGPELVHEATDLVRSFRAYAPVADRMRAASMLMPQATLTPDAGNAVVVLDRLRDLRKLEWQALNEDLRRWLPDFDEVVFDTTGPGHRSIQLRTRGGDLVPADQLSSGTLLMLALLTILHAEDHPRIIGIEEPEVGIHPRLLRDVRDALLRMAYPAENGEDREPRQIIVTTHSPYFLDLFRGDPTHVVIAERVGDVAVFKRLVDHPDIDEILSSSPLGDAWYSGILGGVPAAG